MLTKPDISDANIIACLRSSYGLHIAPVMFLPIGADVNSAVYRVTAVNGTPYFLKLRRGNFNRVAVSVPALLHAQGIPAIMAPLASTTQQLSVRMQGFDWMLYPFFEGQNGFEVALSRAQWITFGATMRAVHATVLPTDLVQAVPREEYSPHWRGVVRMFDTRVAQRAYEDPVAARFAAFWAIKRDEILRMVDGAEQLATVLQQRTLEQVVCHADLHGGNVLVGADDQIAIVDWDTCLLAPKERDLMFVGAGIGGMWNTADEEGLFYQGYGKPEIDPVVIAYYRYERIVQDLAAYAEQIFGMEGSAADREEGLRQIMGQFEPSSVVAIAHRSYRELD